MAFFTPPLTQALHRSRGTFPPLGWRPSDFVKLLRLRRSSGKWVSLSGSVCDDWVYGRLYDQLCLLTRIPLKKLPGVSYSPLPG